MVFLGNNKIKHLTPASEYKTESYYLDYKKALDRLLGKLITKYTNKHILPFKNIDLIQLKS